MTRATPQDALAEELRQRENSYYCEEWEPGDGPQRCLCCGQAVLVPEPLVRGWGIVCERCLREGEE